MTETVTAGTAIAATGLGRRYGSKWALRDCSLRIPAGRVVGVVGPSGAGKSTLMNMMVGLLHPTEGELELLGERVGPTSALERVAHIAKEDALCRNFKVADLLTAGRLLNTRWTQRIAEERLRDHGIAVDSKVGELSCGQRAQLSLAVALATRPELLVLDAPVAGLDPLARKEILSALLAAQAETGCTVVISARDVSELERLCDHLVVLNEGRTRLVGAVDELLERHRVLTGPTSSADEVAAGQDVLHREDDLGHTRLLVRGIRPIVDPQWTVEPVDLATLVGHCAAGADQPVA